jgi:hypothetical protein
MPLVAAILDLGRIVTSPSPHRAMRSGAISPMPPDCSTRLRSLLYDYQNKSIETEIRERVRRRRMLGLFLGTRLNTGV